MASSADGSAGQADVGMLVNLSGVRFVVFFLKIFFMLIESSTVCASVFLRSTQTPSRIGYIMACESGMVIRPHSEP